MKVTDKYVFFWKENPFCNFTKCTIKYSGKIFSSSEQMFMWMKANYFRDNETAEKILNAKTPEYARKLGRLVKNYNDEEWDIVRCNYMLAAVQAKFVQNPSLAKQLCDPKYDGKEFVEASPYDKIWGIGYGEDDLLYLYKSTWGRNELGKILNEVRSHLKK